MENKREQWSRWLLLEYIMYSYENTVMRPAIANNLYVPKEELPPQEKKCLLQSWEMFLWAVLPFVKFRLVATRVNLFPHQCPVWRGGAGGGVHNQSKTLHKPMPWSAFAMFNSSHLVVRSFIFEPLIRFEVAFACGYLVYPAPFLGRDCPLFIQCTFLLTLLKLVRQRM